MSDEQQSNVTSTAARRIASLDDIHEVIGAAFDSTSLLLTEDDLAPEFFDLHSGLAGELFQKATNYQLPLALVVADPSRYGERFAELVFEYRGHPLIRLFNTRAAAEAWLIGSERGG